MPRESKPRHWSRRTSYSVLRQAARLTSIIGFQMRSFGSQHYPPFGGALVCANHQSFFDPVIVGLTCNRRLNYLARKNLFRFRGFRLLIEHLDAIPLDRDGMGIAGIKETIRRLRDGQLVLIFPEGKRTHDGNMSPLMPGFVALARRARVPVVPVGFDGAYQAWPRHNKFPSSGQIVACIGPPICEPEYASLSDDQFVQAVGQRIEFQFRKARALRERASGSGYREKYAK